MFRVPATAVNVAAREYTELVDIAQYAQEFDIEPPCVRPLSDQELSKLLDEPLRTGVPCHTQATERAAKLTTKAAAAVAGADRQDGYSLNKVAFRRRFPGQ